MRSNQRQLRAILAGLTFLLIINLSMVSAGPADAFLAAKTENEKFAVIRKQGKSMTAADLLNLAKNEKNSRAMGFAFGMVIESGSADLKEVPKSFAAALRQVGNREPFASRMIAIVAIAPEAADICKELVKVPTDVTGHQIAARIFATNAWTRDQATAYKHSIVGQPKLKKGKRAKLKNPDWDEKLVKQLIEHANDKVKELGILGAAYLEIDEVKDAVAAHSESKDPGIRAARLLYLVRNELPVLSQDVFFAFEKSPLVPPGFDKAGLALSTYDVQNSPWAIACEAVGELKKAEYLDYVTKALAHGDVRVQIEAARAMERIGAAAAVETLLAKLAKAEWNVRVAVYSALGAIPTKQAIPILISQFDKEKGRCRIDLIYSLASIAGEQMGFDRKTEWENWWANNEKTFEINAEKTKAYRKKGIGQVKIAYETFGTFYKLPIYAERFVFAPDTSNSMKGAKIASLKRELGMCVGSLAAGAFWNIANFGGVVELMEEGKLLDHKQAAKGKARVEAFTLTGGTRIYDALDVAFALPGVEEIILLSDGAPAGGTFTAWPRVHAGIALLNRYRMIALDTMEYQVKENTPMTAGMKELADRNGGRTVTVFAEP